MNFFIFKTIDYHRVLEKVLFLALLAFTIGEVLAVRIYTTMDGPAHLYNASLLNRMDESDFLKSYYVMNDFFLPNYIPHFILQVVLKIADPFTAEKLFLGLIVVGLTLSFRWVLQLYTGLRSQFGFLIFPLVFTNLFALGFFNFSFAFIFFNLQLVLLHYFFKTKQWWRFSPMILLNTLILYYSHPFVYAVSLMLTFLMVILKYHNELITMLRAILFNCLAFLPTAFLFISFLRGTYIPPQSVSPDADFSLLEKAKMLFLFSPGISYTVEAEMYYTSLISILFGILILAALFQRLVLKVNKRFLVTDVFLCLCPVIVIIMFTTHNGILGGLFTLRLSYLFFYFLILWLGFQAIPSKWLIYVSLALITYSGLGLSEHRRAVLGNYSRKAQTMFEASKHISESSVVYPLNLSNFYMFGHYSNYLGLNNEVVILENYEALLGWFPLKWRKDEKFNRMADIFERPLEIADYIAVYGDQSLLNQEKYQKVKEFISTNTQPIYESTDKFCKLYRVVKPNEDRVILHHGQ